MWSEALPSPPNEAPGVAAAGEADTSAPPSEREAAGTRLLDERRFEEAVAEFVAALDEAGPSARLLGQLAEAYDRLDRSEEALAARERITQIDPSSSDAWMRLGITPSSSMRTTRTPSITWA